MSSNLLAFRSRGTGLAVAVVAWVGLARLGTPAVEGEARAYSVRTLNRREIVNDRLGDTPILATW